MPHCLSYSAILSRRTVLTAITTCDNHLQCRPLLVVLRRSYHEQSPSETLRRSAIQANIVEVVQNKYNLLNQHYERWTGISEIRRIQDRVLEAESDFVDITQKRKHCQDQIDALKGQLSSLRDKLESTPRSSDGYLNLITSEHKLLREQLSLDVELSQLKEKEQLAFDGMSKLLRQSHELERLRQERSKYWQIISISLSLAGSLVALIAQKSRNQNSVVKRMESFEDKLAELEQLGQTALLNYERSFEKLQNVANQLARLDSKLDLMMPAKERKKIDATSMGQRESYSWVSYVPGLTTLASWFRYII